MGREAPISKTRRKKDVAALQELGAELVALSDEQLAATDLPEFLRDAVLAARRITSFEARRRQLQYIGKLMRKVDAGPIRARLEAWKAPSRIHTAQFQRTEAWRKRLLAGGERVLAELLAEYPHADERQLAGLIREARHELLENKPPKGYRALFQALRVLIEGPRDE
ncbi:MAG TPA: ribosome biogenesis factor YjgA [Burkholderiales bacterium]|nr:ribosome biogenesis factor YjgA [Burkholderiales bacterium]